MQMWAAGGYRKYTSQFRVPKIFYRKVIIHLVSIQALTGLLCSKKAKALMHQCTGHELSTTTRAFLHLIPQCQHQDLDYGCNATTALLPASLQMTSAFATHTLCSRLPRLKQFWASHKKLHNNPVRRKRRGEESDDDSFEGLEDVEEALMPSAVAPLLTGGCRTDRGPPMCPVVKSQLDSLFTSFHDDSNTCAHLSDMG